ncbi:hypothetical protein [Luteimonas fraxinea]|uniref:hypothetical protein n=1 Tax=Luteimonas fraxinea TaxID=2901869 RepID=UPI001E3A7A03|nr:hypothetical protein [Luteimonas fraxinea]MCD9125484.1 hypothetical protein [Luteimonas fraxinea]
MAPTPNRNRWRAARVTWLALLLAWPLPHAAFAADAAAPLLGGYMRESRIVYPLTVQDWHAQGEHRYEQPEAGVSVRYASSDGHDAWLDVYVYPIGEVGIELLDAHMVQTVGELEGIAGRAHGREIRFGPVQAHRIPLDAVDGDSADGGLRSAGGRMDSGDTIFHTALAVALRQYYFIKGRYSVGEATMSPDAARAALAGFLEQFVQRVRISSTGGCGAPLPVVVIKPHAALPESGLLEVTHDDRPLAVLTGDYRVFTHTQDDPAVSLLQGSGRMMRDARFPGCVGESPVEPEVPDDHREIRIEYRAPPATHALVSVD